jgi:PAS domain S-box-containing protein
MSPSKEADEISVLQARITDLEAQLHLAKRQEQAAETRFRKLADSAPVMFWMAGPDAMSNWFNQEWLEFRGRSMDQEVGNGWTEGLHPDDRDLCIETYLKAFSARQPYRLQFRLQRANGDYCWVDSSGVPRFEEEEFVGFMGASIDIGVRKRNTFTPDETAARMVFALTERERQVLVLIAAGKSTKEAAATLGISYKTADSHRSRILEKLGVHETASMVRYAIRAGLIEA